MIGVIGVLASVLCLGEESREAGPNYFRCQVEGKEGDNFKYAAVELWMPPHVTEVRCILCVVLHPLGRDGAVLAQPEPWNQIAANEHCAIMAIAFAQSDDLTQNWTYAYQGSGHALFASLDILSKQSGIASLSSAPLVLCGVCAAGQFAYEVAAFAPSRVAAFVTIGGGKHDLNKINLTTAIPALIIATPDRGVRAVTNLDRLYRTGCDRGAPWFFVSESISKYDGGFMSETFLSYLSYIIRYTNRAIRPLRGGWNVGNSPTKYLPVSLCGRRLHSILNVEPTDISIGSVDSLTTRFVSFRFQVMPPPPDSGVDDIFVPSDTALFGSTTISKSNQSWEVNGQLDIKSLPLGVFHLGLPVRYLHRGEEVLGGSTVNLTGFVSGVIDWVPNDLYFGLIESGKEQKSQIRFSTKEKTPIKIGAVTSSVSWINGIPRSNPDGSVTLSCTARPPNDCTDEGFSGYFHVQIKSPQPQVIRIFYCGATSNPTAAKL